MILEHDLNLCFMKTFFNFVKTAKGLIYEMTVCVLVNKLTKNLYEKTFK
jgi:hypothetical protein